MNNSNVESWSPTTLAQILCYNILDFTPKKISELSVTTSVTVTTDISRHHSCIQWTPFSSLAVPRRQMLNLPSLGVSADPWIRHSVALGPRYENSNKSRSYKTTNRTFSWGQMPTANSKKCFVRSCPDVRAGQHHVSW